MNKVKYTICVLCAVMVCAAIVQVTKVYAQVATGYAPYPVPVPASDEEGFLVFGDPQMDTKIEAVVYPVGNQFHATHSYLTDMFTDAISRAQTYKAKFAIFVGDLTDYSMNVNGATDCNPVVSPSAEYDLMKTNMDRLIAAGILPFFIPGNHDVTPQSSVPAPQDQYWQNFAESILGNDQDPSTWPSWVYRIQTASESGNHLDRYRMVAYQTTLVGRPLLVIGAYIGGPTVSNLYTNLAWITQTKSDWLAAHPGGHVWLITHEWFSSGGTISATSPHVYTYLAQDPDIELLFAGHWDQTSVTHFGYRASIPGGINHIQQLDIDYQTRRNGCYGLFRMRRNGKLDGAMYETHGTTGWLTTAYDWASLNLGWGNGTSISGHRSISGTTLIR